MTKEQSFWSWFKENEAQFFFLNQINDEIEKERILDHLLDHLHQYCEDLFFEAGGYPNKKQDLIITAGGDEDFFDNAETLVQQAPELEYWNIIALKPPRLLNGIVNYGKAELNPGKMYFSSLQNEESNKIGLRIYVDDYNMEFANDFLNAAYVVVDTILGEKSSALDIGYVEILDLSTVPNKEELIELNKLQGFVKWKKTNSKS